MAEARQRAEWLRAAITAAWIINRNGWTRQPVDPLAIIPAALRPPPEPPRVKSAEEVEEENRRAWALLDRAFGGKR